jgi:aspartyl/asparaginyl-tRNA synthetase
MNSVWNSENYYLDIISDPWYKLIFQIQETIQVETNNFYQEIGMHNVLLPVTTGSISSPMGLGSDSLPVEVNINGKDTYLADSMQFLLEYSCRFLDKGCYYIMPTFRGEKVDERHLAQFFHSEAEIYGELEDIIDLSEKYVKFLSQQIINKHGSDMVDFTGNLNHIDKIIAKPFARITFDEAEKILREEFGDKIEKYIEHHTNFRNITNQGEKELMKIFDGVVWIMNYDAMAVPFYQKNDEVNQGLAKNADLLLGIGETIGCGERHKTAKELMTAIKSHEVDPKIYDWYIKMREKYPIQTSGFGMGIERFMLFLLNHDDIRDVQVFLRFNEGNDIV